MAESLAPVESGFDMVVSGRYPRTDDRVDVRSKRVAYFKPGRELKELINP